MLTRQNLLYSKEFLITLIHKKDAKEDLKNSRFLIQTVMLIFTFKKVLTNRLKLYQAKYPWATLCAAWQVNSRRYHIVTRPLWKRACSRLEVSVYLDRLLNGARWLDDFSISCKKLHYVKFLADMNPGVCRAVTFSHRSLEREALCVVSDTDDNEHRGTYSNNRNVYQRWLTHRKQCRYLDTP